MWKKMTRVMGACAMRDGNDAIGIDACNSKRLKPRFIAFWHVPQGTRFSGFYMMQAATEAVVQEPSLGVSRFIAGSYLGVTLARNGSR